MLRLSWIPPPDKIFTAATSRSKGGTHNEDKLQSRKGH